MTLEQQIGAIVERAIGKALDTFTARLDRLEQLADAKRPGKLLWTEKQAAELLGLAPLTLKKFRCQGRIKAHTPSGARLPLYTRRDLERIAAQLAEGIAENGK
jgi:hypothetical protein